MSLATTLLLPVRGAQALFGLIVMALMADCESIIFYSNHPQRADMP